MDSNLGEPGKDINGCLKICLKMFVMLHIPEALRHTVMPRTPTWVNQEKISTLPKILSQNVCYVAYPRSAQAYVDAMDSNLGEPGKDINICLKFCLKMFVILHILEALRHTLMPWTPTWVNQEKISTVVKKSVLKCLLCCISQKRSGIR